jgi:hypothetical protein
MERVVHLFDTFKPIFYLFISEHEKISFGSVKFGKILNVFELFKFENGLNRLTPLPETVPGPFLAAPTSPVQACQGRSHNMVAPPAHAHHSRAGAGLTPPLSGQAPVFSSHRVASARTPPPPTALAATPASKSVEHHRRPFRSLALLFSSHRDVHEAPPLPTASCPRQC